MKKQGSRWRATVAGVAALGLGLFAACGGSSDAVPDTVYLNAKVLTVDSRDTVAQAFAVKGGKFIAVGARHEVEALAGASTKVVDLGGRTVVPGLHDGHLHGAGGGPGIDLSKTRRLADVLARISEAVSRAAPGEVLQSNSDWHEAQLAEVRMPTRAELDTVAPNHPLVLHRGGLTAMLNSAALAKWNITESTPTPPGGLIGVDASGRLSGLLINNARSLMTLPPPPTFTTAALQDMQRKLNALGITSVRVPGMFTGTTVPDAYRLIRQLQADGTLSLRFQLLLNSMAPVGTAAEVQRIIGAANLQQGEGDEWARIWGVKASVDGGFEGGFMSRAYSEPFGRGGTFFGLPLVTAAAHEEVAREWAKNGYRMAVHVVGDAALDQVLGVWEKLDREKPGAVKGWTIEHAFVVRPEQLDRVQALGANLSVQAHLYVAAPVLSRYWGRDRAENVTPVRTFIERGFRLAGGSDSANMPVNPFWAMYHFITRDTISDGVYGPAQRATRQDVLRMFTINNAELEGTTATLGSIEAGKFADFVVLSGDFLSVPEPEIANLHAVATYVAGRQVYRDAGTDVPNR